MELLDARFFENELRAWLGAAALAIAVYLVLMFIRHRVRRHAKRIDVISESFAGKLLLLLVDETRAFFIGAWAVMAGMQLLNLPEKAGTMAERVVIVLSFLQLAIWGTKAIAFWIDRQIQLKTGQDGAAVATLGLVRFVAQAAFLTIIVLLVLNNLGVNITALVAGLGVGGIAIALAVQNILGDLFASLTIVLDKPFVVGDFIIVGTEMGTVERIGLKTTRVRSLSGEQLIFPNSDLLQSRVRNYKRMQERRAVFKFGVPHETPADLIERIPGIVRTAVEAQPLARFDRAHFMTFSESSLDFETVYWVKSPDYNPYADTQQAINLALIREFAKQGIQLARPARTVFLNPKEAN